MAVGGSVRWWMWLVGGHVWTESTLCESGKTMIYITTTRIKAECSLSFFERNGLGL